MIPKRVVVREGISYGFIAAVTMAIIAILAIGWWGFSVLIAEPKGIGDEHKAVNDVDNRIQSQEWFFDTYNDILAADINLQQAAEDKADNPGDDFHATNYTGLKSHCQGLVSDYNAEVHKVTSRDYLDEQLPDKILDTNPATDCKEDNPIQ